MTRANISWDEITKKLKRGAIRKRTARRYYEKFLAAYLKEQRRLKSLEENTHIAQGDSK